MAWRRGSRAALGAWSIVAIATLGTGCAGAQPVVASEPTFAASAKLSLEDVALVAALTEAADNRRPDTELVDRGLASASSYVRRYATRTIGQNAIASRAVVLRTLLAADTAVAADAALGLLRDTASVTKLSTALTRSRTVADAAAWSLGELGSAALPVFERVLTSGQPATALASLLRASAKLRPVPAQLIEPYLTHVDPVVQRSAAYALTRGRVPASTHALLALATRLEESPPEASAANNDSGGNTVLVDLRSYLARGLGKSVAGDSLAAGATLALQRLAGDPHPHVRINAIRALATYGASARVVLLARLRDPDANARIAIAQSLGDALGNAPADWSAAWAADTSFSFRRALVASAVRVRVRLPALDAIAAPLLRDPDARVRNAAYAAALSWSDSSASTGKPYARFALVQALADDDLFVRASILDALRARASASDASVALRAWRAASRDPENDARVAALRLMAAAWTRDSMSFGSALRDSIAAVPPPADPVERSIGRASRLFAHWPSTSPAPRPASWYVEQVRTFVVPALTGHATRATIATERGRLVVEFFGADAPLTMSNFVGLARRGYYDGLAFHRVVPNFVAQDGDPRGDGGGGPGYAIRDELNRRWYDRGAVGMALSGPDTGGSQYFLAHSPQPHLEGHFTVFGHVVGGYQVLDAIVQGDRIVSVTIQ